MIMLIWWKVNEFHHLSYVTYKLCHFRDFLRKTGVALFYLVHPSLFIFFSFQISHALFTGQDTGVNVTIRKELINQTISRDTHAALMVDPRWDIWVIKKEMHFINLYILERGLIESYF